MHTPVVRTIVLTFLMFFLTAAALCASDSEIARLTNQLRSPDAVVRQQAAEQLGALNDPRAVDLLLDALKDKDNDVRRQVVNEFRLYREERITTALIPLLKDPDGELRQAVVFALGNDPDPRVTTALLEAFAVAQDPNFKGQIIYFGLSGRSDPRVTELLLKLLNDKTLCQEAADALDPIASPRVIEALLAYLKRADLDAYERGRIIEKLGETNDPRVIDLAINALIDREYMIRSSAADVLKNAGELALPGLIVAVDSTNANLAASVIEYIARINTAQAREVIEKHVADQRTQVREAVLSVLVDWEDPRAMVALLEQIDIEALAANTLARPDPETIARMQRSWDALYRLAKMGDTARTAVTALLKDPDPAKRLVAVHVLQQFGAEATDALLLALDDGEVRVRSAAVTVLAGRREPRLADTFLNLAHDPTPDIRAIALYYLANTGHPRATELLLDAAKAPEPLVRATVVGGLLRLGDTRALDYLAGVLKDLPPGEYWPIVINLHRIKDPRVLDAIETTLKSPDPGSRLWAVKALRGWHTPRAGELLCLAINDSEEMVRDLALAQLPRLRNVPGVSTALLNMLKSDDPDTRVQAVYLLADADDAAARDALAAALDDEDPLVRQGAAEVLATIFKDPRSIPVLVEGITAEGIDAVQSGMALSALGAVAVPAMLQFLKHPDPIYRTFGLEWFEENPDQRAVNLILPLLKDKDESVRETADSALQAIRIIKIAALGKQSGTSEQLIAYLKDTKAAVEVRKAAVNALAEQQYPQLYDLLASVFSNHPADRNATGLFSAINLVDDPRLIEIVEKAILNPRPEVSGAAVAALLSIGNQKAIRPLLTGSLDHYMEPRISIDSLLQIYGQQAIDEALICLNGDDSKVRDAAAQLLALAPDPRIPVALISVMQKSKANGASAVISELRGHRSAVASALMEWIARFGSTVEVKHAAEALVPGLQQADPEIILLFLALHDPRAIAPALVMLADDTNPYRIQLIAALAGSGIDPEGRVSSLLLTLVKNGEPQMRSFIILELAGMKHPQAMDLLVELQQEYQNNEDREDQVFNQGHEMQWLIALLKLGDYRGLESLLTSVGTYGSGQFDEEEEAQGLLGEFKKINEPRLNDLLLKYLRHDDDNIRKGAVLVLGTRGEPSALPALLEMLDEGMPSLFSESSFEVVKALGLIKDRRAVPALLDALDDPDLQGEAVSALAEIGDPKTLDALLELAGDLTEDGSEDMIRALMRFDDPRVDALLLSFMPKIIPADLSSSLPTAIIRRIGSTKRPEAVTPLIEMLRTEESPVIRAAIAGALRTITGQNYSMHYAQWRAWQERSAVIK